MKETCTVKKKAFSYTHLFVHVTDVYNTPFTSMHLFWFIDIQLFRHLFRRCETKSPLHSRQTRFFRFSSFSFVFFRFLSFFASHSLILFLLCTATTEYRYVIISSLAFSLPLSFVKRYYCPAQICMRAAFLATSQTHSFYCAFWHKTHALRVSYGLFRATITKMCLYLAACAPFHEKWPSLSGS